MQLRRDELRADITDQETGMIMQLADRDQLMAALAEAGIDLRQWGVGAAKTADDLWRELCDGESELQGPPLVRVVRGVVQALVRRDDALLIEATQVLRDGRIRQRSSPPADKLRPGERYQAAALRCLQEELGVAATAVTLIEESYRCERTTAESISYPGLLSQYTFHIVEARVAALPSGEFWTDERSADDPVARHRWIWQPQPDAR
jgi:ADP-ribose pyrophosphatase YjhB (NUDIX family)